MCVFVYVRWEQALGWYLIMICLPMGVEPVKPSFLMSGCSDRRCPTIPPVHQQGHMIRSKLRNLSLADVDPT